MDKKQGLIVAICAPSQSGKDYMVERFFEALTEQYDIECKMATSYKNRKKRVNDPDYIKCFETEKDLQIAPENRISGWYGNQQIVYDKQELDEAIQEGKIVFIATGSPESCKSLKSLYGNNSLLIYIRRHQPSKKHMEDEEKKRHGIKVSAWESPEDAASTKTANERFDLYKQMEPGYIEFARDMVGGADYIMTNWYTLLGGEWNTYFDNKAERQIRGAICEIANVYNQVNASPTESWRNDESLITPAKEREKNPLSLDEDFMEYLSEKERV